MRRALAFLIIAAVAYVPTTSAEGPEGIAVASYEPVQSAHVDVVIVGEGASEWEAFFASEMAAIMEYFAAEFDAPKPAASILVILDDCGGRAGRILTVGVCVGLNGGHDAEARAAADRAEARYVLAHEYWHRVQSAAGTLAFAPQWLVEGEAEYASYRYVYGDDAHEHLEINAGIDTLCAQPLTEARLARAPYRLGALAVMWLHEHAESVGAPGIPEYWRALARVSADAWRRASEATAGDGVLYWNHPIMVAAEHGAFADAFGITRAEFYRAACHEAAAA